MMAKTSLKSASFRNKLTLQQRFVWLSRTLDGKISINRFFFGPIVENANFLTEKDKDEVSKLKLKWEDKSKFYFLGSIYFPMTIGKVFKEFLKSSDSLQFEGFPQQPFFTSFLQKQTFLINFLSWLICIFLSKKGNRQ